MDTISQLFATALAHHQAGRLDEAEPIYRQVLAAQPQHAQTWNLLGVLSFQRGQSQVAIDCLNRAIGLDANAPSFHIHLGHVYQGLNQTADAIACYRRAVELQPDNAETHYNLANAFDQQQNSDEAIAHYRQALALRPGFVEAHFNLGNSLSRRHARDEAVACYRRAVELAPDLWAAQNNLGTVLREQGKLDEAIVSLQRVLELRPGSVEAYNNLGNVYGAQGKSDEAIDCFRRALELKPELAEAHNNLGNALRKRNQRDEAIACFRRALELNPNFAEAHSNLGTVFKEQGKSDQAMACYRRAIELEPGFSGAHYNLGAVLAEHGKWDQAIACYARALELDPNYPDALNNLGIALKEVGRVDDAVACYRRAVELETGFSEAYYNLGNVLRSQGKSDEASASYRRALNANPHDLAALGSLVHELQEMCQWQGLDVLVRRLIEGVDAGADRRVAEPAGPFAFLSLPIATTALQQLRCARQWVEAGLGYSSDSARPLRLPARSPNKPTITVGYLSADFQSHATTVLMAELLEKHDHERFTIVGYSYGANDNSPMRQRVASAFDRFVDVRDLSYVEAAERIVADEVDILVDLKGYTADARTQIAMLRPAPIQVNYLGYPGTMGAPFIDYILVDDFVVPADQQPYFTEKLVHLPGCYQVNDSRREIASHAPSRAACGLPDEGFVFCSFNNAYKITAEIFAVWMRLLDAVPGSVLWLLEANRFAVANLRSEAKSHRIAPERLVFAPRTAPAEHLARHRLANLFLDTLPYNAHTTASDSLWAGCPLVTIAGEAFASRVAGSLLRDVGLSELITTSLGEYETLALRLARDPSKLAELRARLQANRSTSPLFDGEKFARAVEQAYSTMWVIHAAGEPPRAFRVEPTR